MQSVWLFTVSLVNTVMRNLAIFFLMFHRRCVKLKHGRKMLGDVFFSQVNYTGVMSIGSFALLRYLEKSTARSISSTSSLRRCPSTSSFDFPNILQIDFTMPGSSITRIIVWNNTCHWCHTHVQYFSYK